MQDVLTKAREIQLVVFDVDGVLTDGTLFISDDGQEHKAFHSRDGHGMMMLKRAGIEIGIITGRTSQVVAHRMADLGVVHVYQGQREKLPAFERLLAHLSITPAQTAFVGDDVVDLPIMTRVGLAIAVQDAHPLVQRHAHWVTGRPGGKGAAREVCELLLEAKSLLDQLHAHYLA